MPQLEAEVRAASRMGLDRWKRSHELCDRTTRSIGMNWCERREEQKVFWGRSRGSQVRRGARDFACGLFGIVDVGPLAESPPDAANYLIAKPS
jgi:hypothetical protein